MHGSIELQAVMVKRRCKSRALRMLEIEQGSIGIEHDPAVATHAALFLQTNETWNRPGLHTMQDAEDTYNSLP